MLCKMSQDSPWHEMIERAQNFRWNVEKLEKAAEENAAPFIYLYDLKKEIIEKSSVSLASEKSDPEEIKSLFTQIYDSLANQRPEYKLFLNPPSLKDNVFDACFFTTLSGFLNTSKRIKGKSFHDFVYDNDPLKFRYSDSPNYGNLDLLNPKIPRRF